MDQNGRASKSGTLILGGMEVPPQAIMEIEQNDCNVSRGSSLSTELSASGSTSAAPHLQQQSSDATQRQMNSNKHSPQLGPAEATNEAVPREEQNFAASRSHQGGTPVRQTQQQYSMPISSIPPGPQLNCVNPACLNLQIAFQKQAAVIEELKGTLLQFGLYCQTAAHNLSNVSHLARQPVYIPSQPNAAMNQQTRMATHQMMGLTPAGYSNQHNQQRMYANDAHHHMSNAWVHSGPYNIPPTATTTVLSNDNNMKRRMATHNTTHTQDGRTIKEVKFVETAMVGAIGKNGIYWQPDKGRWFIEWDDGEGVKRIFFPSNDPNQSSEMVLQDAVRQRSEIVKKLMEERNILLTPPSPSFDEIQQHITDFAHRIAHNTEYETTQRVSDDNAATERRLSGDEGVNDASK